MNEQKIPVKIESYNQTTAGKINLLTYTKSQRTSRALSRILYGLLITIACVFIPIAHFILVPAGLILTPLWAYLALRQNEIIMGGEGICPKCSQKLTIMKHNVKWPLDETCAGCSRPLTIMPANL